MSDEPACGKGLAEHSVIPAKISELLAVLVDNLKAHLPTLDPTDENATRERAAYASLITQFGSASASLRAAADEMAGYRDLPMARHLETELAAPEIMEAFRRMVRVEAEVLDSLGGAIEQDRQLLEAFDSAGRG